MDASTGILASADIRIDAGTITAIGPDLEIPANASVIEADGLIAIPGLVNAHAHLWQTAVRGVGINWSGLELHLRTQSGFATAASVDFIRASTLLGALALLDSGTTSVLDWCHGGTTNYHALAALESLDASGIRAVFARGTVKTLPKAKEPHFSTARYPRADAESLLATRGSNDGRVTLALALLGPSFTSLEVTLDDFALAADLGLASSSHVGRSPGAVEGGYVGLAKHGADLSRHNVVHGTQTSNEELAVLLAAGASITATSAAEVRTAPHAPMTRRVEAAGGHPSLGSDSAITGSADMFTVMRDSLMLDRLFGHLAAAPAVPRVEAVGVKVNARDTAVPPRLTPTSLDALRWATVNGASALGLSDRVGTLSVGKQADIVLLDSRSLSLAPALNPVDAVVGFGSAQSVHTVMVAGEIVKSQGHLLFSGLDDLIDEASNLGRELAASLGFDTFADPYTSTVY
jgi:cytosine/adenosine deaminase-related metal-dependent hydrolase